MSEAGLKVQSFETGAVRSTERQGFRYDLITPVGLRAMATYYQIQPNWNNMPPDKHIAVCLDFTYAFLANPGEQRNLYAATAALFHAVAAFDQEKYFANEPMSNGDYNYHLIPRSALKRVAAAYDEGAKKYSAYNCEKGMPVSDTLNHAIAHLFDWLKGDTSEDHLGHACWNYLMAIHNLFMHPTINHGLRETPLHMKGFDYGI